MQGISKKIGCAVSIGSSISTCVLRACTYAVHTGALDVEIGELQNWH